MTRAEYNLLTFFLQNPDRALTREMILNSVWGYDSFPQHPNRGCARGAVAAEAGAGFQQPAPLSHGSRSGLSLPALGLDL